MIKKVLVVALLSFCTLLSLNANVEKVYSQEISPNTDSSGSGDLVTDTQFVFPKDEFYTAEVVAIQREGSEDVGGYTRDYQVLLIKFLDGPEKGQTVEIDQGQIPSITVVQKAKKGDKVVISKSTMSGESSYAIIDKYRIEPMLWVTGLFVVLIVGFGRKKGFMSIFGLAVSVLIIIKFTIPQIVVGANPLFVTVTSLVLIACLSLYLAHGFNKRTSLALASTLITLGISLVLALFAVAATKLNGMGTEEAFFLQLGPLGNLNLQGLLLSGILLGTLGVLDDVTTAQTATIDELKKANPSLSLKELYKRGISVGNEHIASLVNTLFLAYAGSALPLFLLFTTTKDQQPLWLTLNSEQIAEEIIRTIVGSSALVLAVPISTLLAAYVFSKKKTEKSLES
jgi:uncharacterized membrane protein